MAYLIVQVLAVIVVAVVMALSLAHALELPGKLRLKRDQYLAVQPIYYPGFTIGGAAEPLAILLVVALLVMTPTDSFEFPLMAGALAALIVVQLLFWTITSPVNRFWLMKTKTGAAGRRLFGTVSAEEPLPDWERLRDRWERSHLLRSVAAMAALLLLVVAVAI